MNFSAAAGAVAPTTVHTSAEGLSAGRFELPVRDGTIDAYHAAPAGRKGLPVVLVIQEIFGMHEHIQDVCRRFAHAGYLAITCELYQRQGDAGAYADTQKLLSEIVTKVSDEQVLADLDACVKWAAGQGADTNRLGVTGFCWGGRLAWMYAAHNPAVKAGVAWYGRLATGHSPTQKRHPVDIAGELHGPVLGLYGAQDASIPLTDVETMKRALAKGSDAARQSTIVVYPDAGHAFYADYRPSFRADDARDAWKRTLDWFGKYL